MICYKDMTFCTYYADCKEGNTCTRALTDQVKREAFNWWNHGIESGKNEPPICTFAEEPDCFNRR